MTSGAWALTDLPPLSPPERSSAIATFRDAHAGAICSVRITSIRGVAQMSQMRKYWSFHGTVALTKCWTRTFRDRVWSSWVPRTPMSETRKSAVILLADIVVVQLGRSLAAGVYWVEIDRGAHVQQGPGAN
jgi:hypothetical protein